MGTRDQESGLHPRGVNAKSAGGGIDAAAMQHLLGFLLAMADVGTRRVFERHVGHAFDLREVEFTLLVLLRANHGAAPKQLALALNIPAPKLTLLLDKLMARGLLQRRRSPTDGRARQLHLTPKGEQLTQRAHEVSQHMEDGLLQALSPAERAMLRELLLKVGRAAL